MKTLKTTIQILLLTISLNTYSQIVFNNTYDIDSLNNSFKTQIELDNNDFLVGGVASQNIGVNTYSFITRTNQVGEIVWKKKIDIFKGHGDLIVDLLSIDNSFFILGSGIDTSTLKWNTYLLKLNQNGDSLYSKILTDTLTSASAQLIYKNNHFYTSQYYETPNNDVDIRMIKMDTFGNILDEWVYGGNDIEIGYAFEETEDDGFIISGSSRSYTIDNNSDFLFIKLDSLGNIEWQNTYGTSNDETVRSYNYLESTIDGGFVMLGDENVLIPDFHTEAVVLKIDSLGNQLWRKNLQFLENTYGMSLREWQDGSLIVTGTVTSYDTIIPFFEEPRAYLLKLSADGQTEIWRRYFSKFWSGNQDYVNGMILTSDGGILTSGWVSSVPWTRNDAWLTKFDSCGYTVGDIPAPFFVVDSLEKTKEENTVFLTEQSQDYCTAEIDWGDGSDITKYYAYENNLPLQEKQLQHTFTENGTYTIKTTALAGEEYRTYEVEIEVNGISVGINSFIPEQAGISLFPNPADEFVIVQNINSYVIPAQAGISNVSEDSFLQRNDGLVLRILDINGKLIKNINLNPKLYQQKIDISSLNNGVYFVKFEKGDVLLGTEKLVIAR